MGFFLPFLGSMATAFGGKLASNLADNIVPGSGGYGGGQGLGQMGNGFLGGIQPQATQPKERPQVQTQPPPYYMGPQQQQMPGSFQGQYLGFDPFGMNSNPYMQQRGFF